MSIKKNNTYFKENDGKIYYYDEKGVSSIVPDSAFGTLKDELENTSAELANTIETTSGNIQEQIDNIGSPLTYSGAKTVDEINALENIKQGTVYTMSNSGTITAGNIDVEQSDEIAYAVNQGWVKIGKDLLYSDYYKKTETSGKQEIQDALDLKQNTLTAGTDIVINNGVVISINTNGSAIGEFAFVEGENTFAGGLCDHVEGMGGIADNGGMNHIEGFQYYDYANNGASSFAGKNVVEFYRSNIRCNGNSIDMPLLYDYVKAFKDNFIVTLEYGGPSFWHYSQNPFYDPMIYKIVDVNLGENSSVFYVTLDRPLPDNCGQYGGGVYLLGPTSFTNITRTDGSLSSGQVLNTYRFSSLGFPGHNLENVRLDNAFFALRYSYTLTDQTDVSVDRLLRFSSIEYDESSSMYTFTTEESIEIPEILGGGYSCTLYINNPTYFGCNHIEGAGTTVVNASYAHAEGQYTRVAYGNAAHAEGYKTVAAGYAAHAEGYGTSAGEYSHAEGSETIAKGQYSHAEGNMTSAIGDSTHAEGQYTEAIGHYSHAEGSFTTATEYGSHAEGEMTYAAEYCSHTEGWYTSATGECSHAEGASTIASGDYSHAEGGCYISDVIDIGTSALAIASHTEGIGTIANTSAMHVGGTFNKTSADALFVIGNGTTAARSDALIVSADGTVSSTKLATSGITDVEAAITALQAQLGNIETALNAIINGSNS